jgi:hypothetical protein
LDHEACINIELTIARMDTTVLERGYAGQRDRRIEPPRPEGRCKPGGFLNESDDYYRRHRAALRRLCKDMARTILGFAAAVMVCGTPWAQVDPLLF